MYHKPPIYYNLSLINGYGIKPSGSVPANIEENNNQIILDKSSDYYIAIARTTVPTAGIPRIIVPIQTGLSQTDQNKCIYTIVFKYETAPNVYNEALTVSLPVTFISEFTGITVLPPSQNGGNQDLSNDYYWIYDIEQILLMFNNTLQRAFATFCSQVGLTYNPAYFPYITFDPFDRSFSINMTASVTTGAGTMTYFDQNTPPPNGTFPRIALWMDGLSLDLLGLSARSVQNGSFFLISCFNKFNNVSTLTPVAGTTQVVYQMTSSQSSLSLWQAMSKIIFTCTYGISTIQEYDSVPIPNQGSTNPQFISKPVIPMLTDLEVDKNLFSLNDYYIQFQSSNISQQRLISITGDHLQSFSISVYWLDVFGNRHPVTLPQGVPLTIKLAFYDKKTFLL